MNKKTDTKLEIIKAALRLFLQKGLEKTSMNEIATTLGIKEGTVMSRLNRARQKVSLTIVSKFEDKTNNNITRKIKGFLGSNHGKK